MTTTNSGGRSALVFGASGITGWAIVNEAVSYPSSGEFERIIGLTNRPMSKADSFFPADDRIVLASGINLTAGLNEVVQKLKQIDGTDEVTDLFFAAYIQAAGGSIVEAKDELTRVNVEILETAVRAVEIVSPKLQFVSLQTGGNVYGWGAAAQIGIPNPGSYSKESDPRIPQPYAKQIFYYAQSDALAAISKGKAWRYTEIRPNDIVGFVPSGSNPMNLAQALGLFLAFYASRERTQHPDTRLRLAFPSSELGWNARVSDVSQRTLARAHIFASSIPSGNGEAYNVGDAPSKKGTSWAEKWPAVCAHFGIEGVGPGSMPGQTWGAGEYMRAHRSEWTAWEAEHGLKPGITEASGWEFLEIILQMAVFDRVFDLTKITNGGFKEHTDSVEAYVEAFELMQKARILPSKYK